MTIRPAPRKPLPVQGQLPLPQPPVDRPASYFDRPEWDDRAIEAEVDRLMLGGVRPPESRYPLLKSYNGATGQERRDGGNKWWIAVRYGLIPRAALTWCSVCLSKQNMQAHNENYFRPCNARPVCTACHRKLHRRFYDPNPWLAVVHANRYPGAWFTKLAISELSRDQSKFLATLDDSFDVRQIVSPPHRTRNI